MPQETPLAPGCAAVALLGGAAASRVHPPEDEREPRSQSTL
jgi:hypothetical protein